MLAHRYLIGIFFLLTSSTFSFAMHPFSEKEGGDNTATSLLLTDEKAVAFHEDSVHQLNFRYADKRRGIKPWIAPGLMFAGGTILHLSPDLKDGIHNFVQKNLEYSGSVDNYLQFAPLAAVYLLNLSGVQGKNNFGNRSAIAVKSIMLNSFVTYNLKVWINAPRPNLEKHSFPSGHTSTAFTFAHFMHREYGEKSPWYSIGAYTGAAVVGLMRMGKNVHWLPDVLAGAGIGILSTEFVYLTHQYKWDMEHLKRLDIFPFRTANHKGVSLVYTF